MDEFMHVAEIALPLLLQGLGTTAAISVLSILIAMVLGSAVGYMCLSKNKAVELIARAFISLSIQSSREMPIVIVRISRQSSCIIRIVSNTSYVLIILLKSPL